jgi:hypothetical protein
MTLEVRDKTRGKGQTIGTNPQGADADLLHKGVEASNLRSFPPGSKNTRRQAGMIRAEKSHSNARDGDITGRLRYGVEQIYILSIVEQRSVGELTANNTRRVKLGAKCQ